MQSRTVCWAPVTLFFATAVAFAQSSPTFEVASVSKGDPLNIQEVIAGKMKLGMTIDAAMVHITRMSIAEMMRYAYKVKSFQIQGPDWLNVDRFNVTAKMPPGSSRDDIPQMMQALLADRFKLQFHRTTADQNVYALVVLKSGLKLKESAPEDPTATGIGGAAAPLAATPTDGSAQIRASASSDASGNVTSSSVNGDMKMVPSENGMKMEISKMNTVGMVEVLGRVVDRPVVDMSGLKGRYDMTLEVGREEMLNMARAAGLAVPIPAGPGAAEPGGSGVFASIQQFGLKLEPRKAPVDLLVIDHVERTPTEN